MSKLITEIPKAYQPETVETKWYRFWTEKGFFTPRIDPSKKPFTIIMPPPNVTGQLHVGHALTAALEDIMVRWHRMRGEPTLWLPGTDHAGIATQVVVEQALAKEGLTRQRLGREEFIERVWEWVHKYGGIITEQHKRLGASCDWTKERFTLDEGPSRAVRTTFVNLYNKGLIYRGERIINWCPRCTTALSDLEVQHKELEGNLWFIKYHLADEDGFITVATTRPETILGDTAVAVNPTDTRYTGLLGKKVLLPGVKRVIPIVADEAVDPAFGTGAVKVTPSHDPVDFDIAQRQGVPSVNILNPDGTMNENAGPYKGLDRFACRKAILEDLERDGLFIKVEKHLHSVGHCDRCKTPIEPLASKQWFVATEKLAKPAIDAVVQGKITIIPERFKKVYLNWMENLRDWCISRQLWWGHRIPVWYCSECGGLTVTVEDPQICSHCTNSEIYQDPDVLDTWFSSALWPHSTLGWPAQTKDLRYFYPTAVMETGYDILFFWVARMIMMGLENTGRIPFETVYLHGLIRDESGEKMSKLRGNVINPLEAIKEYGTDALRFAITTGSSPGNDIRLSRQKLEAARNFCNKLWNASRYVQHTLAASNTVPATITRASLHVEDRWILSRLNRVIASVNHLLDDYQFGEAEKQVHEFVWGEFCDWYIELSKIRLRSAPEAQGTRLVLLTVLDNSLRLLHPFMPFITEELWQSLRPYLPHNGGAESIMIAPYPVADVTAFDEAAQKEMESVIEIIRAIRNARTEAKVEPSKWIEAQVYASQAEKSVTPHAEAIQTLARVRPLQISDALREKPPGHEALVLVLSSAEVVLPLRSMIDVEAEKAKLDKEIEANQADAARLEKKLGDTSFTSKAPANIIARDRQRLGELNEKLARLKERRGKLT